MKHRNLRLPAAVLLLALSLPAAAACQTPPAATPDTDGTTLAGGTTAATTEAATTEKATDPVTEAPTTPVTEPETETEAPVPEITLTVDGTYSVYLSDREDSMLRMAAELAVEKFREMANLELAVVDQTDGGAEGEAANGIYLEIGSMDEARDHRVTVREGAVTVTATDAEALYFATEAVLEAWLSPDSGYVRESGVYLDDLVAEDLSAVTTRLDTSIRILSQNMRGTDDPDGNTVQLRSARFIQLVEEYQPDLIGTQEYTYSWQVWLKKHEKQAGGTEEARIYGQVGCSRNGPDSRGGEWNAILYRLDRFELLDSGTFWLSDTPDVPSETAQHTDKRICTWAKLRDLKTGEIFVYANTHLDHTNDEVRAAQATILLEQLAGIVGDLPLYLTGDFNCSSASAPCMLVKETLKDAHATAWRAVNSDYGTYHDYHPYGTEIDFIFHGEQATPIRYEIVTKSYDGYVSDHYAVFAEFVN